MLFGLLRNIIDTRFPAIFQHPFNQGLCKGTLPKHVFQAFVQQDILYLKDQSHTLLLLAKKMETVVPDHACSVAKLALLAKDAAKQLEKDTPSHQFNLLAPPGVIKLPIMQEYSSHMLNQVQTGSPAQGLASVLACPWIYMKLGQKMRNDPCCHPDNPYFEWVKTYSEKEFMTVTSHMLSTMQLLGEQIDCGIKQKQILDVFTQSIKYEIKLWNTFYPLHDERLSTHDVSNSYSAMLRKARHAERSEASPELCNDISSHAVAGDSSLRFQ